jgi:hypothetical protein
MAREFAVPDTMSPSLEARCARTSANIGEMAERFKAAVLKTAVGVSLPWVRIPLSPPTNHYKPMIYIEFKLNGFFTTHVYTHIVFRDALFDPCVDFGLNP